MIRQKLTNDQLIIDLRGPQGNAYSLIGLAIGFSRVLGLDKDKIVEEMKSGDYENLIRVFDSYFGNFVILER